MKKGERLSHERFHALAEAELAAIPAPLRNLLANVAIEIKDAPGLEAEDLENADETLGLYTGPTRQEMLSADASGVLPAKIYLYQRALEDVSPTLAALKKELRLTLRHELAHHFGFDDAELERNWPEGYSVPPAPDVDALILCGKRLAARLGVPCPSDEQLRATINDVLVERTYFACWREGIIFLEELRNVLLAHLQTFLCNAAGVREPGFSYYTHPALKRARKSAPAPEYWYRQDVALCRDVEAAMGPPPQD